MTPEEAKDIAESFIASQDMRDHTAAFVEAHKSKNWPVCWTVNFDLRGPGGGLVDGGLMVVINEVTREARFFDYSM